MELYIHAGLNKAGSSYIQEVLYVNSDRLREYGISYHCGEIKGANATPLSLAIRRSNHAAALRFLAKHLEYAQRTGCKRILLSSESLYHDFAEPKRHAALRAIVEKADIKKIHILLFFRQPVSHAISTFCHRSNVLGPVSFSQWIRKKYEFPRELRQFLETYDRASDINWSLRAYQNGSLKADIFDWLEIPELAEPPKQDVNVSITVAEAKLLTLMPHHNIVRATALYYVFKAIPLAQKASDALLREEWERIASAALAPYNKELERLSDLVGAPMTVRASDAGSNGGAEDNNDIILSTQQAEAIMKFLSELPARRPFLTWLKNKALKTRYKSVIPNNL